MAQDDTPANAASSKSASIKSEGFMSELLERLKSPEGKGEMYRKQMQFACSSNSSQSAQAQLAQSRMCDTLAYLSNYEGLSESDRRKYQQQLNAATSDFAKTPEILKLTEELLKKYGGDITEDTPNNEAPSKPISAPSKSSSRVARGGLEGFRA